MVKKNLNHYVEIYKEALNKDEITVAYVELIKFVSTLRTSFAKNLPQYTCGTVFPGYMDYTYFYFYDDFLRGRNLRFGLVLNHKKMRFELWLLGQNEKVQSKYWDFLKDSSWNKDRTERPIYSVLEVVLVEEPNFDDLKLLEEVIQKEAFVCIEKIESFIQQTICL